jgi:lipopolysaccharide export LptBFGC system permease protein LptF
VTTVLDRYIFRSLIVNYVIALGVMLSLYVVLDMFVNMDEFTENRYPATTVIINMIGYYVPNLALYFAQLGGGITLFACAAVLARMRKFNEVTAVLASGVSLYRLARPVVIFGVLATGLLAFDTEVIVPSVAHKLARKHEEADSRLAYEVLFLKDRDGALLSAGRFEPETGDLRSLLVMVRDESGAAAQIIEADGATWEPPSEVRPVGQWRLERGRSTTRVTQQAGALGPRGSQVVRFPEVYPSDLGPKEIEVRQAEGWIRFLSLSQLRELGAGATADQATIMRTRHSRVVTLIMSLLFLLLGLPFFLDRSPANIVRDATKCMIVCGLCYVVTFIAQSIRLDSASAFIAWIPILIFGPLAMVLFDRVRT